MHHTLLVCDHREKEYRIVIGGPSATTLADPRGNSMVDPLAGASAANFVAQRVERIGRFSPGSRL